MKRTLLLAAALGSAGMFVLHAQQVSNDANPLYRPTSIRLSTITVPPITGVPFSATALIENQQMMPDRFGGNLAEHQSDRPGFPGAHTWGNALTGAGILAGYAAPR